MNASAWVVTFIDQNNPTSHSIVDREDAEQAVLDGYFLGVYEGSSGRNAIRTANAPSWIGEPESGYVYVMKTVGARRTEGERDGVERWVLSGHKTRLDLHAVEAAD